VEPGDLDAAIVSYGSLIENGDESAVLLSCRGQVFAEQGDYAAAITDLEKAIASLELSETLPQLAYSHRTNTLSFWSRGDDEMRQESGRDRADFETSLTKTEPSLTALKRKRAEASTENDLALS